MMRRRPRNERRLDMTVASTMVGYGEPGLRQAVRTLKDYAKDDERGYRMAILASVTCSASSEAELADAGCLIRLDRFSREAIEFSVVKRPWKP